MSKNRRKYWVDYASQASTTNNAYRIYLIMGYQFDGLLLSADQIFSPL